MHDVHAAVDERVREADLVAGDVVAPVGAPVDRDHDDVARAASTCRTRSAISARGRRRRLGQEVDAGPVLGRGPAARHAAGGRAAGEDQDAPAAGDRDGGGAARLGQVAPRARRSRARRRPGRRGSRRARRGRSPARGCWPGRRRRAGPRSGRAGWRGASGSGRPCPARTRRYRVTLVSRLTIRTSGRGRVQHLQRVAPGPGEVDRPRDRAVHRLGQLDVGPGVPDVRLPQRRVAGVRKDLVDAAAEHHVAAEEQGHRVTAHASRLGRGRKTGDEAFVPSAGRGSARDAPGQATGKAAGPGGDARAVRPLSRAPVPGLVGRIAGRPASSFATGPKRSSSCTPTAPPPTTPCAPTPTASSHNCPTPAPCSGTSGTPPGNPAPAPV